MSSTDKHDTHQVIVYTGDGKGKTSAGLGLTCRALGHGSRVAFIQFIKNWHVSEDTFFDAIQPLFTGRLTLYKGGKGFYHAGHLSAKGVSDGEHQQSAQNTLAFALQCVSLGTYDVVVCDEINNAVHDGLLRVDDMRRLIESTHAHTTLCLTGRHFPPSLEPYADLISNIQKIKHPYDKGMLAIKGIDY